MPSARRIVLAALAILGVAATTLATAAPACAESLAAITAPSDHDCEPHETPVRRSGDHPDCAMAAPCASPVVVTPTLVALVPSAPADAPMVSSTEGTGTVARAPESPPPRT